MRPNKFDRVTLDTGHIGECVQDGCTKSLIQFSLPADHPSGCSSESEWIDNDRIINTTPRGWGGNRPGAGRPCDSDWPVYHTFGVRLPNEAAAEAIAAMTPARRGEALLAAIG